jgi:hypothetical protein
MGREGMPEPVPASALAQERNVQHRRTGSLGLVRSQRIRIIGGAKSRPDALLEAPTLERIARLRDFELAQQLSSKQSAGSVIDQLNAEVTNVLKPTISVRGKVPSTPKEFQNVVRRDVEKYRVVIKAANIQAR